MDDNETGKVISNESFTDKVAGHYNAQPKDSRSYIESTIEICESLDIDVEDSKSYMTKALVASIQAEASKKFLLKEKLTTLELF